MREAVPLLAVDVLVRRPGPLHAAGGHGDGLDPHHGVAQLLGTLGGGGGEQGGALTRHNKSISVESGNREGDLRDTQARILSATPPHLSELPPPHVRGQLGRRDPHVGVACSEGARFSLVLDPLQSSGGGGYKMKR